MNIYKVKNRLVIRNNRPELQKEFKTKEVTFLIGWQWNKFGFGYRNNALRVGWLQFRFVPPTLPNVNIYWAKNSLRIGRNMRAMKKKYGSNVRFLCGVQWNRNQFPKNDNEKTFGILQIG